MKTEEEKKNKMSTSMIEIVAITTDSDDKGIL